MKRAPFEHPLPAFTQPARTDGPKPSPAWPETQSPSQPFWSLLLFDLVLRRCQDGTSPRPLVSNVETDWARRTIGFENCRFGTSDDVQPRHSDPIVWWTQWELNPCPYEKPPSIDVRNFRDGFPRLHQPAFADQITLANPAVDVKTFMAWESSQQLRWSNHSRFRLNQQRSPHRSRYFRRSRRDQKTATWS